MAEPKKLKDIAAAAVAKLENERRQDFDLDGDCRDLIEDAKAKLALKATDVSTCVKKAKNVEKILVQRKTSWEGRVEELKKLAPLIKKDQEAYKTFMEIKTKAAKSKEKYDKLYTEFAQLGKTIAPNKLLSDGMKCTVLLNHVNVLRAEITKAANFLA